VYGQPAYAPSNQVDVGSSFSWAWATLWKNAGPFILATLTYVAGIIVVYVLFYVVLIGAILASAGSSTCGYDYYGSYSCSGGDLSAGAGIAVGLGGLLLSVGIFVVAILMVAGLTRGALAATRGEPVTFGMFFSFEGFGRVLGAMLLVSLIAVVSVITIVGPLFVAFFFYFTVMFVIDKGLGPIEAMKASFDLAKNNVGPTILVILLSYVIDFVGSLACGVGVLVSTPLTYLFGAHLYRRLIGEQPVPAPA